MGSRMHSKYEKMFSNIVFELGSIYKQEVSFSSRVSASQCVFCHHRPVYAVFTFTFHSLLKKVHRDFWLCSVDLMSLRNWFEFLAGRSFWQNVCLVKLFFLTIYLAIKKSNWYSFCDWFDLFKSRYPRHGIYGRVVRRRFFVPGRLFHEQERLSVASRGASRGGLSSRRHDLQRVWTRRRRSRHRRRLRMEIFLGQRQE